MAEVKLSQSSSDAAMFGISVSKLIKIFYNVFVDGKKAAEV